jgi:hypothetical protein
LQTHAQWRKQGRKQGRQSFYIEAQGKNKNAPLVFILTLPLLLAIERKGTREGKRQGKKMLMGLYEGFRKNDHLECEITRTTRSRLTINIKSKIKIFSMKWLHL